MSASESNSGTPSNSVPNSATPAVPPKKKWIPATAAKIKPVLMPLIESRPLATRKGPLQFMSFNGHFLNLEKAQRYEDLYLELFKRAHVVCLQETDVDALRYIKGKLRYGISVSHRSARDQACGMLFHPRMQWVGKTSIWHDYLCDLPGHPEMKPTLRPGVQRRIIDSVSQETFDVTNVHLKSNIGEEATVALRRWQIAALVKELTRQQLQELEAQDPMDAESVAQIVAGDFNCPIQLDTTTEMSPLLKAGFQRVSTPNLDWSHRWFEKGGQFDGFFVRGLRVQECFIPKFYEERSTEASRMRDFSDHQPVFMTVEV